MSVGLLAFAEHGRVSPSAARSGGFAATDDRLDIAGPRRGAAGRGLVFSEGVFHFEGWLPGVLDPLPPDVLVGLSAFALEDGVVYHTYSTYDRGTDALITTWQLLDRTPRVREDDRYPDFPRRHDEYEEP